MQSNCVCRLFSKRYRVQFILLRLGVPVSLFQWVLSMSTLNYPQWLFKGDAFLCRGNTPLACCISETLNQGFHFCVSITDNLNYDIWKCTARRACIHILLLYSRQAYCNMNWILVILNNVRPAHTHILCTDVNMKREALPQNDIFLLLNRRCSSSTQIVYIISWNFTEQTCVQCCTTAAVSLLVTWDILITVTFPWSRYITTKWECAHRAVWEGCNTLIFLYSFKCAFVLLESSSNTWKPSGPGVWGTA